MKNQKMERRRYRKSKASKKEIDQSSVVTSNRKAKDKEK